MTASTDRNEGATARPWAATCAQHLSDGECDWGISAEINGRRRVIAESFGRVAEDVRPNAEANAALICRAVNTIDQVTAERDALAKALEIARARLALFSPPGSDWEQPTYTVIDAALSAVRGREVTKG